MTYSRMTDCLGSGVEIAGVFILHERALSEVKSVEST